VWLVQSAAAGCEGIAGRVLASRPLVYLGTISYGVYVWHGLVPIALYQVEYLGPYSRQVRIPTDLRTVKPATV
jgi:peptidoglycan/LPS O-acetylase OafA/YrhL